MVLVDKQQLLFYFGHVSTANVGYTQRDVWETISHIGLTISVVLVFNHHTVSQEQLNSRAGYMFSWQLTCCVKTQAQGELWSSDLIYIWSWSVNAAEAADLFAAVSLKMLSQHFLLALSLGHWPTVHLLAPVENVRQVSWVVHAVTSHELHSPQSSAILMPSVSGESQNRLCVVLCALWIWSYSMRSVVNWNDSGRQC